MLDDDAARSVGKHVPGGRPEQALLAGRVVVNLARGYPLISIAGTILIGGFLWNRWVRAGRPRGIDAVERKAEAD